VGVSVGVGVTVAVGLGAGVAVGVGVAPLLTDVKVIVTGAPAVPAPPVALKGVATNVWLPTPGVHAV
jgi:hypothetical protein